MSDPTFEPDPAGRAPRVEVFEDAAGEFRWHKLAGNSKVTSESGESFTRREDAHRSARAENPEVDESRIVDVYPEEES